MKYRYPYRINTLFQLVLLCSHLQLQTFCSRHKLWSVTVSIKRNLNSVVASRKSIYICNCYCIRILEDQLAVVQGKPLPRIQLYRLVSRIWSRRRKTIALKLLGKSTLPVVLPALCSKEPNRLHVGSQLKSTAVLGHVRWLYIQRL